MPVLPLIDLMLLSGWTALLVGFVLKIIHLTTAYRPTILSMTPIDFLMIAVAAMLFAIALAARTWVKQQEATAMLTRARAMAKYDGFSAVDDFDDEAYHALVRQRRCEAPYCHRRRRNSLAAARPPRGACRSRAVGRRRAVRPGC